MSIIGCRKEFFGMKKTTMVKIALVVEIVVLLLIIMVKKSCNRQEVFYAEDFGFTDLVSSTDKDADGIDDFKDMMLAARTYVETNPPYKSEYYEGGYPTDGYGVCTDVIWHAFKDCGYDLKTMVDQDIAVNKQAYETIEEPDPNIDFRRVKNLKIFFDRKAVSLPIHFKNPQEWQPGDIVVFESHIAICSDKRNKKGIPFIIHAGVKSAREKNEIENYKIVGHYRWE